jgi:nucleotide-binding universal stress UspA family protein
MLTFRQILYPMDFSERCLSAAPFVAAMAKRYGSKITLLSVIQPTAWADAATPGAAYFIDPETLRASVAERLEATLLPEFAGIEVVRVAMVGDPASTIVEYARDHRIDLIMMPTHGYGPFRRMLLGSVTSKVLHDAACPVWTGAHAEVPPTHSPSGIKTVVCAVERLPEQCFPLAKWAAQFAKDNGAALRLVHVIPAVEAWPERQLDVEFQETLRKQAREEIEKTLKAAGLDASLCIVAGGVPASIREEARRHNADLVIIGRGVMHETLGRLRTHTHAILRESPCPVISI